MKVASIIACSLIARVAVAQTYYVRQGANGSADGSDWANAYPDLPASMQRGAIYYLAAGIYQGHTFNDPESGTSVITVKKATIADHGTATGWSSAYASGEALFTSSLVFRTGYYTIDGQTGGGPGSWESGFGIRIYPGYNGMGPAYQVDIIGQSSWHPPMPTNFIFRHIDFQGYGYHAALVPGTGDGIHLQCVGTQAGDGVKNITFSYCYIHDLMEGEPPILAYWLTNFVFEYSEVARNYGTTANHSSAGFVENSNNWMYRYDRFVDIESSSVIAPANGGVGSSVDNGIHIYGNVVYCTPSYAGTGVGLGFVGFLYHDGGSTETISNVHVYNNTVVDCTAGIHWGVYLPSGTNQYVYNNLWVNSKVQVTTSGDASDAEDDNTLINCTFNTASFTGANDEVYASGNPFVNSAAGDFRLSAHTDPGIDASSLFTTDMLGNPFDPAHWDRGAFAYADAAAAAPGSDGGNLPTGDATAGCACNGSGSGRSAGGTVLLLALVGRWASRRRRLIAGQ